MSTPEQHLKTSRIALGICLICVIAILETAFADHARPNPASPFVWALLGAVAVLALAAHVWFRRKSRQRPG
jgi:drug/metabolite transporter (DMT)-like permease